MSFIKLIYLIEPHFFKKNFCFFSSSFTQLVLHPIFLINLKFDLINDLIYSNHDYHIIEFHFE